MHEGGCLCGHVRYRFIAQPIFVNCCHCRDCQKLTGSAFAINAMIEADRVDVTSDGRTVTAGDVDKAMRCPKCKTLLWATHRLFGDAILFLRAGTLDRAELIEPDAHFFVSRSHRWIVLPAGVPAFAELPGPDDPSLMSGESRRRLAAAMGRG
ncbi:MAG TPA: GFA family protein [Sphingomicrobium sp.]|nr:GFA family protein [Sphingomicrobium sp.]